MSSLWTISRSALYTILIEALESNLPFSASGSESC